MQPTLRLSFTLIPPFLRRWVKRISRWLENHYMHMDNQTLFIADVNGSEK
jgi:hypothetical protein